MTAVTPQPGRRSGEADTLTTSERILDAAEALFAEKGFAGTAVRDIATRAGLHPGSLYNHFESKQALYEAVLQRGLRPIYEILDRAADPEAPPGPEMLVALMAHLSASPALARLIQHETLAGGEHAMRFVRRWLEPVYARASLALERSPNLGDWDREELPLLLMTYHHLIFGHYALAGALGQVLDIDLLSSDAVERHTRFLVKLSERLLGTAEEGERGGNAT
ncbi:MAG: TetR/AcrR family transcriptional regulator [Deltaproteobacteria bacterium]|nr:TetR/AcrR family transcriptional regulator [Deltaproteobacteria bacterium]